MEDGNKKKKLGLKAFITALIVLAVAMPAYAQLRGGDVVSGYANVLDGDTLDIQGQRIRLFAIDAPEKDQVCYIGENPIQCGLESRQFLEAMTANQEVSCQINNVDKYGRGVAVCAVAGNDINAQMVLNGQAIAYRHFSEMYVQYEDYAKSQQIGIWGTRFIEPYQWRKQN